MNIFLCKNREVALKNQPIQSGFTLIELITVIVILSILASIGTGFVVSATESYQRTQTRALLTNTARQALERMTRQLRIALPYSVRLILTTTNDKCVEFMPIAAGGYYLDPVADPDNGVAATTSVAASPVVVDFGTARFLAIGAMQPSELYGATAASRANYAGYTEPDLHWSGRDQWQRNSISQRYFLLDNPQAFCLVGTELRFYADVDVEDDAVNVGNSFSIIARDVSGGNPFSLQNGAENRQMLINISLDFSSAGESLNYTQGVFIRNVP